LMIITRDRVVHIPAEGVRAASRLPPLAEGLRETRTRFAKQIVKCT
jgi:hypothetical protein